MAKNKDSWCSPLYRDNEPPLYGGAARNKRIAEMGGIDAIIAEVGRNVLEKANFLASASATQKNVILFKRKAA
jgi:hypothetical protein